jgi:SAM-dependent methyltransferase
VDRPFAATGTFSGGVRIASSYDTVPDFGALYDQVPAYSARRDIEFYVAEAERHAPSAGAVLDLGCGTGRLLLPLARAGHRLVGVDRSPAMLARCREKLAHEPSDVRSRATLHEADVRDFDVRRPTVGQAGGDVAFTLAIAPFRILQHLVTIDDQLRCLASIRRHLAPGGRLAFDVFNPNFALITTDRSAEAEDTPERPLGDGRFFRRTARVLRVRWTEQVSEIELIYYLRMGDQVTRVVQAFEMRWYAAVELEHLLARAGFAVDAVYGDFERGPLRDGAPEIVVVARRD